MRFYSACDYDETAEEMVFTNLLEGHEPDIDGGSNFQKLDELIGVPVEGTAIDHVERDGTVVKHSQTIRHWAGNVPRVDDQGKVINRLKQGYKEFDHKGGHYVGQVDEDGLPSG